MSWPNSRLTTYAPGVAVKSADLNAMQDEAIRTRRVWLGPDCATSDMAEGPYYLDSGGEAEFQVPVTLGERVTAIKVFVRDSSGTAVSAHMADFDRSSAPFVYNSPRTPVTTDASGTDQVIDLTEDLPFVLGNRQNLVVVVSGGGATKRYYGVEVTYERWS